MFFHDFQFLPNKVLIGVRISVHTEYRDSAEKRPDLHHLSFFEMLQGLVGVALFLDVPDDPNTSKIANEGPCEGSHPPVPLYLLVLHFPLLIQPMKSNFRLVFISTLF